MQSGQHWYVDTAVLAAAAIRNGGAPGGPKAARYTQTTNGVPYTFSNYSYNLADGVKSFTMPSGRGITIGQDSLGRPSTLQGVKSGVSTNYVTATSYTAHGAVQQLSLGNSLTETWTHNSRLQPVKLQAGGLMTLDFTYGTGNNNGNPQTQTITRGGLGVWTQGYFYDGVNRLQSASEGGTGTWSQGYGYDARGNRWVDTSATSNLPPLSGETPNAPSSTSSAWFGADNRIAGWAYDEAGNLTGIAGLGRAFTYDAEGRQLTASVNGTTASYTYDGNGRRVTKTVGGVTTVFVYDAGGNLAAEYGGVAPGVSGPIYLTGDHLGSTRLVTNGSGASVKCYDYLPFGEEIPVGVAGRGACYGGASYPGTPDVISGKFTGKERDAETGLDYFGARYFSGAQGRFTSPDPLDWLSWQNGNDEDREKFQQFIGDPQGFNQYSYARNNPLKYVDPTGEDFELAVTFNGDATDEEKARILGAIRQYLVNLKIGNVVVRDAAVKSDDNRTWGQTVKDFFTKDFQSLTVDFTRASYKDATNYIFAGDMAGKGEFGDLRRGDPSQWSNIIAWRALHETIAHKLSVGSDFDQAGGLRPDQFNTLVGGAYGIGRPGIPGLNPYDTRKVQNELRPRIRSYGR
jgi:RHS repeat-associated protein